VVVQCQGLLKSLSLARAAVNTTSPSAPEEVEFTRGDMSVRYSPVDRCDHACPYDGHHLPRLRPFLYGRILHTHLGPQADRLPQSEVVIRPSRICRISICWEIPHTYARITSAARSSHKHEVPQYKNLPMCAQSPSDRYRRPLSLPMLAILLFVVA